MAKVLHAIGLAGIFFLTVAAGDARGQTQAPPPHAAPAAPAAAIPAMPPA